jgi:hypothetical protein
LLKPVLAAMLLMTDPLVPKTSRMSWGQPASACFMFVTGLFAFALVWSLMLFQRSLTPDDWRKSPWIPASFACLSFVSARDGGTMVATSARPALHSSSCRLFRVLVIASRDLIVFEQGSHRTLSAMSKAAAGAACMIRWSLVTRYSKLR